MYEKSDKCNKKEYITRDTYPYESVGKAAYYLPQRVTFEQDARGAQASRCQYGAYLQVEHVIGIHDVLQVAHDEYKTRHAAYRRHVDAYFPPSVYDEVAYKGNDTTYDKSELYPSEPRQPQVHGACYVANQENDVGQCALLAVNQSHARNEFHLVEHQHAYAGE